MIKSLKIRKLFGLFSYDIDFTSDDISIITGPNGYGKTTLLKLIYALSQKNIIQLARCDFRSLEVVMVSGSWIKVSRINAGDSIEIAASTGEIITFDGRQEIARMENEAEKYGYHRISEDYWYDSRNEVSLKLENLLTEGRLPNPLIGFDFEFPEVYLIREHRLVGKSKLNQAARNRFYHYGQAPAPVDPDQAILEYAAELKGQIGRILANYSQTAQQLDSTFPQRLFSSQEEISREEFENRYDKVKRIQADLSRYGLSFTSTVDHPTYKTENAKALAVYIDDAEKKQEEFTDLIRKLSIFTEILNGRRFIFKQIKIDREFGFRFESALGVDLPLGSLSSGEQHELILLYELLFRVQANCLVLIDEPEISLHVAWQKAFLDDLRSVIKNRGLEVIIATHSPQIINGNWDLVCELEKLRLEKNEITS